MSFLARLPPAVRGAFWMVFSGLGYVGMAVMIRYLSPTFTTFELLFFRNLVALLILAPWMMRVGRDAFRTTRLPLHFFRTVLAYIGMLGLFYGISRVPLGDVIALQFTQPLFIVFLAVPILGERLERRRVATAVVGFLGVLVILRPGFAEIGIATVAVLVASLVYAGSNLCIKLLVRTDPPNRTVIYVNLLMLPLSLVPALFVWKTPDAEELLLLALLGIVSFCGVFGLTRAYNVAEASAVVPYDFLRLPFAAAAGYLLFGEATDAWTWIGATVIFAAAYLLVRFEARKGAGRA